MRISRDQVKIDLADRHLIIGRAVHLAKRKSTCSVTVGPQGGRPGGVLARLILNPRKGLVVDHINGNPLDNRRENLRVVSYRDNNRNRPAFSNNRCGYKGVHLADGRWRAIIYVNGVKRHLGRFDTAETAACAYDKAARQHFGKCATLNFPANGEQSARRPRSVTFMQNWSPERRDAAA